MFFKIRSHLSVIDYHCTQKTRESIILLCCHNHFTKQTCKSRGGAKHPLLIFRFNLFLPRPILQSLIYTVIFVLFRDKGVNLQN